VMDGADDLERFLQVAEGCTKDAGHDRWFGSRGYRVSGSFRRDLLIKVGLQPSPQDVKWRSQDGGSQASAPIEMALWMRWLDSSLKGEGELRTDFTPQQLGAPKAAQSFACLVFAVQWLAMVSPPWSAL
jgi:hypothetical protein